jgi:peptide subunit release factor 1 (eRF1)
MRVRATQRFKQMACPDCGLKLTVGSNTRKAPRCVECGVAAYEKSAREIVSQSGENYDKYVAGLRKFAENL